jgi:hypothetical protein
MWILFYRKRSLGVLFSLAMWDGSSKVCFSSSESLPYPSQSRRVENYRVSASRRALLFEAEERVFVEVVLILNTTCFQWRLFFVVLLCKALLLCSGSVRPSLAPFICKSTRSETWGFDSPNETEHTHLRLHMLEEFDLVSDTQWVESI